MERKDTMRRQTNPVFTTAESTARFLAASGNEDARLLLGQLGFDTGAREGETANWNAINLECRYEGANGFIDASDLPNVVDLPCGYTPRALRPELRSKRYLGLDLPAVAEAMAVAVDRLLSRRGEEADVAYRAVDATNYALVRSALDDVEGEVYIATEGLLSYYTQTELDETCDVIHRILAEFGGVWVTPDPDAAPVTFGLLKALLGPDALRQLKESGSAFGQQADSLVQPTETVPLGANSANVGSGAVMATDPQKVVDYFESKGFQVDREPMSAHFGELKALDALPAETAAKVREVYDNASMWVLSVPAGIEATPESAEMESGDLIVGAEWAGTTLRLHLVGRLDSVSAPELLDFYQHQTRILKPQDIVVDASRLKYISSAGIRTLLIFAKQAGEGRVTILHADEFMRKVLEETGAADFFGFAE